MIALSKRLNEIAGLVPKGSRVADIGTDHGYLSVFMAENGIASFVLACDINEKPLNNARRTIETHGAENIELRLCDGLAGVGENEIDTVVIAGMGAEVIVHIIEDCPWIKNGRYTLILQPMTSPEILRERLNTLGFTTEKETAVAENGKVYCIIKTRFTGVSAETDEAYFYVGKLDPAGETEKKYLLKQYRRFKKCADDLEQSGNAGRLAYYRGIAEKIKEYIGEN